MDIGNTLRFARRLSDRGNHMWIRFVLVPGLTDAVENVDAIADFVATLREVDRVEVLPFHQFGVPKWEELGVPYQLGEVRPPEPELVARVEGQFRSRGLNVGLSLWISALFVAAQTDERRSSRWRGIHTCRLRIPASRAGKSAKWWTSAAGARCSGET